MLILKYFFTVGLALTAGLFALSTYLESEGLARAARIHSTASLPITKPAVPVESELDVMVGPVKPDKPAKAQASNRQSGHSHRRSVH